MDGPPFWFVTRTLKICSTCTQDLYHRDSSATRHRLPESDRRSLSTNVCCFGNLSCVRPSTATGMTRSRSDKTRQLPSLLHIFGTSIAGIFLQSGWQNLRTLTLQTLLDYVRI